LKEEALSKKKKNSDLTAVGDILSALKTDPNLKQALDLASASAEWAAIVGETIAPHGRLKGIRDKVLYVETENSVWAHRYTYHKRSIIRNVNKHVGRKLIKDVFVVLAGEEFEEEKEQDEGAESGPEEA